MINVSLDVHQQLQDDLNMIDDCSTEVANVTSQVSTCAEQQCPITSCATV